MANHVGSSRAHGTRTRVEEGQIWKVLGTEDWGGAGHVYPTEGQQVENPVTRENGRET